MPRVQQREVWSRCFSRACRNPWLHVAGLLWASLAVGALLGGVLWLTSVVGVLAAIAQWLLIVELARRLIPQELRRRGEG